MDQDLMLLVNEWYEVSKVLKEVSEKEKELRQRVFGGLFPTPTEGTNSVDIGNGYKLKAVHKINRKVEVDVFLTMRNKLEGIGVSYDSIVRWTPELEVKYYRSLSDAAKSVFDTCMTIKPGMPTLTIAEPK